MHVVSVVLELVFPLERCVAVLAVERPGVRVNDQVLGQGFLNSERLVADLTLVRFFT